MSPRWEVSSQRSVQASANRATSSSCSSGPGGCHIQGQKSGLTLTAYNLPPFCARYTFPKAPRLMGFTMVKSSMEGGLGTEILFTHFPVAAPLALSSLPAVDSIAGQSGPKPAAAARAPVPASAPANRVQSKAPPTPPAALTSSRRRARLVPPRAAPFRSLHLCRRRRSQWE